MHQEIHALVHNIPFNSHHIEKIMCDCAQASALELHRALYVLNLSHLDTAWGNNPIHVQHPMIVTLKHKIENEVEKRFINKYQQELYEFQLSTQSLDNLIDVIGCHSGSHIHPLDHFIQTQATLKQIGIIIEQEAPLEMLFGDLLSFLLPGVYGQAKMEILRNYWDEMGRGKKQQIHRQLRSNIMKMIGLKSGTYRHEYEHLHVESLEFINAYLSVAVHRARQAQLLGMFLATELCVANHFEYIVAGFKRLGFQEKDLEYYTTHISIDTSHAEDWINKVIKPILAQNPKSLADISMGVFKRLTLRGAMINRLYEETREAHDVVI